MNPKSQIVPISEPCKSMLDLLPNGPVYLAQHSRPTAVLLSTKQWDRLNDQIEDMAALIEYLEVKLKLAEGETGIEGTTLDELTAELSTD